MKTKATFTFIWTLNSVICSICFLLYFGMCPFELELLWNFGATFFFLKGFLPFRELDWFSFFFLKGFLPFRESDCYFFLRTFSLSMSWIVFFFFQRVFSPFVSRILFLKGFLPLRELSFFLKGFLPFCESDCFFFFKGFLSLHELSCFELPCSQDPTWFSRELALHNFCKGLSPFHG